MSSAIVEVLIRILLKVAPAHTTRAAIIISFEAKENRWSIHESVG
ncbi:MULTISPECIES: hypothetical protein [unclassified Bradyrhizobium]|nr:MULTISPECIES: hypothetical protein [unclassified Bradyrhizobium]